MNKKYAFHVARTVLIGCLGGLTGYLLNLPLGWLVGSMLTTSICAMSGMQMPVLWSLRSVMIGVIGLMAGSAFTPEILAHARQWSMTMAGVGVYSLTAWGLGIWVCCKFSGQNRVSAIFSSAPGGLSEILSIAPSYGADVRALSLIHGMRLAVILALSPIIASSVAGGAFSLTPVRPPIDLSLHMPLPDVAILAACLLAGAPLARAIRLPAAHLTGPLVLSALAHGGGLTAANPPQLVIVAAQVVIGASVAQFFANTTWRMLVSFIAIGGGLTLVNLGLAALFAAGFAHWLDVPFATALIALVPGGLPEMSLVAIGLGLDAAFVSAHHLFRILVVLIALPVLIARFAGGPAATEGKSRPQA